MESPEAMEYEDFVAQGQETILWKVSEPVGGRMINSDPVFTSDEKFLILAQQRTLNVYSTSNSLLIRSIKPKLPADSHPSSRIITYQLSPSNPNLIWVAFSTGYVFSIDWTTGAGAEVWWKTATTDCIYMTVASMVSAGRRRDVVFTTETKKDGFRITAQELIIGTKSEPTQSPTRTIYTTPNRIRFLKTAHEGSVIAATSGNKILLGRLRSNDYDTVEKIRYEFRIFESIEPIKSLDIRVSERTEPGAVRERAKKMPVVDVVVGDIRGVIFVHNDLLGKLFSDGKLPPGISISPRKLHWHRQVVHTVKFSKDGNYVISGGTETVLVLWQLDTGKKQFIPHMEATIQNVVVSPTGTSYAIQSADNSAMVMSTAELKATAYVAGIRASVLQSEEPIESNVPTVENIAWAQPLVQRTPAVISPVDKSRLFLAVGQSPEINATKPLVINNTFLQTFNLGTGRASASKQSLTRNNITNINIVPSGHRISEPRVIHMKISHDGKWLVTVDEWMPPLADLEYLGHRGKDLLLEQRHRREVFLKFWQWSEEKEIWELVSRIDKPHALNEYSSDAGRIFALANDPSSSRFATIGEDGIVRTWAPKTRKRDSVVVRASDGSAFRNWHCERAIGLGKPTSDDFFNSGSVAFSEDGSVLAAACNNEHGLLHLIDVASGTISRSHTHLFEDAIVDIEFLGQDVIVLSNQLFVFDVVADKFRLQMLANSMSLDIQQKQQMMHLAVDTKSRTFAVALPEPSVLSSFEDNLWGVSTELTVFHQDSPREPQYKQLFSTIFTALLPAVSSEGYLVLDTAAEIYTVMKNGTQAITSLAQPTSELGFDNEPEPSGQKLIEEAEEEEEIEEDYLPTPAATQDGEADDDEDKPPAITQHQLAEIFDGPSFALPPMEELFYKVAALCASKPRKS